MTSSPPNTAHPLKPRLVVLEGPAGVGKTTLQHYLWKKLVEGGISAGRIPEFSESSLGAALSNGARYGQSKPDWVTGIGGALAFLADKIRMLETASRKSEKLLICDRVITSQLVLSVGQMDTQSGKEVTAKVIYLLLDWIQDVFSNDSIVVFLDAPAEVLEKRLQSRLGHPLSRRQTLLLKREIQDYGRLSSSLKGLRSIELSSDGPVSEVGQQLMNSVG